MAAALAAQGTPVVRVALRRAGGATEGDGTHFLREEPGSAARAFLRRPLRALGTLLLAPLLARSRNKEGGRLGALLAAVDGLRLSDWARRRGDVSRLHAQFSTWEGTAAWAASRVGRVPFSFEVHAGYAWVRGRLLLRAKARAAAAVVAISEVEAARLRDLAPEAKDRVALVRCGVTVPAAPPAVETPRHDVVAVGRLAPAKGLDVLVDALALLARRRPGVSAAIVGEGPERSALERRIESSGAPVTLLGLRDEAQTLALLARATVATLPCVVAPDGDEDGIPVSLMEAMAAGVPVVSTPVGGIAELLEDGQAGVLVPSGDPVSLATAIGRLLDDPAVRARYAAAGRAAVAARHEIGACARRLAAVLSP
jgi:glycosyltransferase involved in cell wall biosynthesis